MAGDFTDTGTYDEIKSFFNFLMENRSKFEKVLVVPGNHEMTLHESNYLQYGSKFHKPALDPKVAMEIVRSYSEIEFLCDSGFEFRGLKFWGTPWVNPCGYWSFCLQNKKFAESKMSEIPKDTDVLVSHSPPFDVRDKVMGTKVRKNKETGKMEMFYKPVPTGSRELMNRINAIVPRINIFGHIHECHGFEAHEGVLFLNASIMNDMHRPENLPTLIRLSY